MSQRTGSQRAHQRTPAAAARGWRALVLQHAIGFAVSPLIRLLAAFPLGFAILMLSAGWLPGPARLVDAWHYRDFSADAQGRIVESWLAVDFDVRAQADLGHWAGAARATHCAVVEWGGDWGESRRRAYCGNRVPVHGEDVLPVLVDEPAMAPGVPFAMPRDERGFALPELRIGTAESAWLRAHPPFWPDPAQHATAWDALRAKLDRPLEAALVGRAVPVPSFPLRYDPRDPADAMPTALVEAKRAAAKSPTWFGAVLLLGVGAALWLLGMRLLMAGLPRAAMRFAAALPLLLLPWWGEHMPRALARVQPQVAEIVADMVADLDLTGRLVASSPADAQLARGGERLRWRVGEGRSADTIGQIVFEAPAAPAADADAALRALLDTVTTQVRAFDPSRRATVFARLAADKRAGYSGAGLLFVPIAREVGWAAEPRGEDALAAQRFLDAWVTQPVDEPSPGDPGYRARIDAWRSLLDAPEPTIANRAGWIVERAGRRH